MIKYLDICRLHQIGVMTVQSKTVYALYVDVPITAK